MFAMLIKPLALLTLTPNKALNFGHVSKTYGSFDVNSERSSEHRSCELNPLIPFDVNSEWSSKHRSLQLKPLTPFDINSEWSSEGQSCLRASDQHYVNSKWV